MGKVFVITNQKGGVGKTTTTINIGAALARLGKRTLIIDADPQGNATTGLGVDKTKMERGTYDILISNCDMQEVIFKTYIDNLHIIPANIALVGAEIELVERIGRELCLKEAIEPVVELYDYILIDCPPSLGLLTLNSLSAADQVIVPIQCEFFALEGLSQLINTIKLVKHRINKNLEIEGVVLTMFDARTNLSLQVAEEVKKYFHDKVHTTVIPRNVRLGEAPSHGLAIFDFDPSCIGATSYLELAKEILKRESANA